MDDSPDEDDPDVQPDPSSWDLEIPLEEARRRYDKEEQRRQSIESKIATMVTVNALIISFISVFSNLDSLVLSLVLTPAIISVGLGLISIRSKAYKHLQKT
ncbi:hypothetical protein KI372_06755 [Halobacterium salinarum]|uniref:hypothetical protein n=1 Tax=Halobacterium salinarum TaxID=2242 RepID=UPI001F2F5620|nr:hypothetical protein [Halobacterium salinarum]MCF2206372.1 hypothetical protein [Halobacterium salinarum]MCF2241084.1 hypothetical protein [Halobacterium salinarum]